MHAEPRSAAVPGRVSGPGQGSLAAGHHAHVGALTSQSLCDGGACAAAGQPATEQGYASRKASGTPPAPACSLLHGIRGTQKQGCRAGGSRGPAPGATASPTPLDAPVTRAFLPDCMADSGRSGETVLTDETRALIKRRRPLGTKRLVKRNQRAHERGATNNT